MACSFEKPGFQAGNAYSLPLPQKNGHAREMVALLWKDGHSGATVRLEHLWHRFCREKAFSLFCAYPRIGFTQDAETSIKEICDVHSRVVAR